jgi:DNA-directed RNA polymerase subunit N
LGVLHIIIPIRCFTCGKLVADKWDEFRKRVHDGENPKAILDELGFDRYCCRRMLMSHVNLIDEIMKF